jgi:hypothetical protein
MQPLQHPTKTKRGIHFNMIEESASLIVKMMMKTLSMKIIKIELTFIKQ